MKVRLYPSLRMWDGFKIEDNFIPEPLTEKRKRVLIEYLDIDVVNLQVTVKEGKQKEYTDLLKKYGYKFDRERFCKVNFDYFVDFFEYIFCVKTTNESMVYEIEYNKQYIEADIEESDLYRIQSICNFQVFKDNKWISGNK